MIGPNQSILPHYILNNQIQIPPTLLLCTSSSPSASSSSLSYCPLYSACPGAGRCIGRAGPMWRTRRQRPPLRSQPRPSASGTGGALDTPSSWRGGSVGVCYLASGGTRMNDLFFIIFDFEARASAMVFNFVVVVDDMSCELLYHLLL